MGVKQNTHQQTCAQLPTTLMRPLRKGPPAHAYMNWACAVHPMQTSLQMQHRTFIYHLFPIEKPQTKRTLVAMVMWRPLKLNSQLSFHVYMCFAGTEETDYIYSSMDLLCFEAFTIDGVSQNCLQRRLHT